MEERKINTLINHSAKLKFGDYLLFQKYEYDYDYKEYSISKPIYAIYLGCFVADQTIGFNYVKWINENHNIRVTNQYVTNHRVGKEVEPIEHHIEWDDYIDILGHWNNKANFNDLIKSYRKSNPETRIIRDGFNVED